MFVQRASQGERFEAHVASMRFFASVGVGVSRQGPFVGELFLADVADVGIFAGVHEEVGHEAAFFDE